MLEGELVERETCLYLGKGLVASVGLSGGWSYKKSEATPLCLLTQTHTPQTSLG